RFKHGGDGVRRLMALQEYVNESLETSLLELVKLRASQINGCAYCIDMHTKDAAAHGETQQRLHGLVAWRECPYYTERERAALEWTEAVTLVADGHVPDEVYERVSAQFNDKELSDLTLAVATINAWNRLAVAARTPPGTYKPAAAAVS